MAATISRIFSFVEFEDATVSGLDESAWTYSLPAVEAIDKPPAPVKTRWIYAFQLTSNTTSELYAEYFADTSGTLSLFPGAKARIQERKDRSSPVALGSDSCTLPRIVNGTRVYYFFFLSRIRLHLKVIKDIEAARPKVLSVVDLSLDESFHKSINPSDPVHFETFWLGVLDPITIAFKLHWRYEVECNQVLVWTTEFAELPEVANEQIRMKNKCLILAKLLKQVVDNDPTDTLGLVNEFANGDRQAPAKFINDHQAELERRILVRDRSAESLCRFVDAELLTRHVETSYRIDEKNDYAQWIVCVEFWLSRLNESPNGKARIGKLINGDNYLIHTYVLSGAVQSADVFAVGRKVVESTIALWSEVAPAYLMLEGPGGAAFLAKALNIASAETGLLVEVTEEITYPITVKRGGITKQTLKKKMVTSLVPALDAREAVARWMGTGDPTNAMKRFFAAIELINLAVAATAIFKDFAPNDRLKNSSLVVNLLGGLTDAFVAFGVIRKLANKPIKIVGAIAAVLDVVGAGLEGINAYNSADTSNLVGQGIVGVGSALIGIGCFAAITGAGAAFSVIGLGLAPVLEIVGGILVVAGTAISAFTKDSDIELFAAHCRWGTDHHSGQTTVFGVFVLTSPDWATANFSEWNKGETGLDHQIASLISLMLSFVAEARGTSTVRIYPGIVHRTSKVFIKFNIEYFGGNVATLFRPQLWLDFESETMSLATGSDPADISKVTFGDLHGRAFVEVNAQPVVHPGIKQVTRVDCEMILDVDGDGKILAPNSKKLVPYHVSDLARGINSDHVKSTDKF